MTAGDSSDAQVLRARFGSLSGPEAFDGFILLSRSSTPLIVMLMCVKELLTRFCTVGIGPGICGVNTELNCSRKISALDLLSLSSFPFRNKGETPTLSCFFYLMNFQNGFGLFSSRPC